MTKGRCQPGQPLGRVRAEVVQPKPVWILGSVNLDNLVNLFNIKDYICAAYEDDVSVQKGSKRLGRLSRLTNPSLGAGFQRATLKRRDAEVDQ